MSLTPKFTALDLFAGAGGWSVACQRLNIQEHAVELMPEAIATREAAGFPPLAYEDAWQGLPSSPSHPPLVPAHDILIASPPCQTFSVAGNGQGRRSLDAIIALITSGAYRHLGQSPSHPSHPSSHIDPRSALVLTPLAYAYRYRPRFIVLEQVPSVLPVWQAFQSPLESMGYTTAVGYLHSEQFGVPQTRKRAFLVASLSTPARPLPPAALPTPTHSKYYPTDPSRTDPDLPRWVSMREALSETDPDTATDQDFTLRSNYGTSGDAKNRGMRGADQPAPTITSKAGRMMKLRPELEAWKWLDKPATTVAGDPRITSREHHYHGEQNATSLRLTAQEAAILQGFPADFPFQGGKGKQFLQIGNAVPPLLAEAVLRALLFPVANPE